MKSFIESAAIVNSDTDAETWRVRLIQEGQGSSGYYSASLLENFGHAFDNTVSYLNHTDDVSKRNFTEIAGRVVGRVWTEKEANGKVGLYANWRPDDDHRRKLEQYRDALGLSIFINGEGRYDDEKDTILVESFDADDPFRSVDVVVAPGANGRLLTESLKRIYEDRDTATSDEKPGVTSARETKGIKMDQEIKDAFAALHALIAPLVAKEEARVADAAQVEADEAAVSKAVESYDAAVKAIDEADLLPSQIDSLRAEAKKGADVAPLIEAAKQVKADAIAALGESNDDTAGGRVITTRTVESAVDLGKALA